MKRERTTGAKMLDWTLRPREFCLHLLSRCHRVPIPLNNSCIRVTDAVTDRVTGDSKLCLVKKKIMEIDLTSTICVKLKAKRLLLCGLQKWKMFV